MRVATEQRSMVSSERLKRLADSYGLTRDEWHIVPEIVYRGTEEMQRGYLQALFTADGTVAGEGGSHGVSVRLNSSYPDLLEGVQMLLLNFGIASHIYLRRGARVAPLPDGRGDRRNIARSRITTL